MDPTYYSLKSLLAQIQLDSFYLERGIRTLEQLANSSISIETKKAITEKLVVAFVKKGWFKDAINYLISLKSMVDDDVNSTKADHISFWRLASKNYLRGERYKEAIFCVDKAIMLTDSQSFNTLGKLYFLRGKILQLLCRSSGAIKFPTTLKPEKEKTADRDDSIGGSGFVFNISSDVPFVVFRSSGDLVQECAETFKQASLYLDSTGDEIHLAKTTACLAEMYLEYCFLPVAFFDIDFSDCATIPYFPPSIIAQNTREAESKKIEEEEKRKWEHEERIARKKNQRLQKRQQKSRSGGSVTNRQHSEGTLLDTKVSPKLAKHNRKRSEEVPAKSIRMQAMDSRKPIPRLSKKGPTAPPTPKDRKEFDSDSSDWDDFYKKKVFKDMIFCIICL